MAGGQRRGRRSSSRNRDSTNEASPNNGTRESFEEYIGRSIRKYFKGYGWYNGRVVDTEELADNVVAYNIYYDEDGDEEQIFEDELLELLVEEDEVKETTPSMMAFEDEEKKKNNSMNFSPNELLWVMQGKTEHLARYCGPSSQISTGCITVKWQSTNSITEVPIDSVRKEEGHRGGRNRSRRSATRQVVNYMVDHLDENEFTDSSSEEEEVETPKKGTSTSQKRSRSRSHPRESKHLRKQKADDDSDFEEPDTTIETDSEDDNDNFFEEEPETPPAKKRKKTGKKGQSSSKVASGDSGKKKKKSMAESCDPINAPPHYRMSLEDIKNNHTYLDPCGVEATDGIIDRLVGDMVDRIGLLWQRSLASTGVGSQKDPLKLGTACSGTDAPALALTLLEEQLKLRQTASGTETKTSKKTSPPLFSHRHIFSCENEAFKSAYLARNFDSTLYPDIAKLCDDPPLDVYGRPQLIEDFNLFVAGTSCKNFSMLRSNKRIDIEDKGCSGETFIAAIEVLFQAKPRFAIFENVTGAPWEKMSEYITGRIKLSSSSEAKAIKEVSSAEKAKDLTFVLEKGNIIVDHVPGVFGVRCGSVVKGYLKGTSSVIRTVKFPAVAKSGKSKTCSLTALLETNSISRAEDTLVFETGVTYCTKYMKVDTKKFGLPQTRERVYMFVWQPNDSNSKRNDNLHDDLGEYWEAIVRHLESPVRHSLESFVLQPDHDIIRVFREALNGPPGRTSKRSKFLEPDFWTSTSANLKYSTIMREKSGMEPMARSLTKWGPYGQKQIPPHYWLEYCNLLTQRQLDMIEILHAWAARDAESHDSSFSSFFWNISQNVGKEKHRGATSGIAGCITPGGEILLPHQGRPLLGSEKLMIQGIPYFRLLLGNETEVQLGDLAGNAMSLTVVCATMLGAMCCNQLRRECLEKKCSIEDALENTAGLPTIGLEERLSQDMALASCIIPNQKALQSMPLLKGLLDELVSLSKEAMDSSILCTSESSGTTSQNPHFLLCDICNVSCSRDSVHSTAGIQLDSHTMYDMFAMGDARRRQSNFLSKLRDKPNTHRDHGAFLSKLRDKAPPLLIFSKDGIDALSKVGGRDTYRVKGMDKLRFNLHCIRRDHKKWLIIYYARSDSGTGEAVAEFRITLGQIERRGRHELAALGVRGELTSFLPAKLPPLTYGKILPCATITVLSDSIDDDHSWMYKALPDRVCLKIVGKGETNSFRKEMGLTNDAAEGLLETTKTKHKTKLVQAAKKRGEIRRWTYASNWEVWPEFISISGNDDEPKAAKLSGEYKRAKCRQTINQSALWVKSGKGKIPPMYLLLQPEISRNGPDRAIISTSISHDDDSSVLATFPIKWQPCDALNPDLQVVENVILSSWSPLNKMNCYIPPSNVKVTTSPDPTVLAQINGLGESEMSVLLSSTITGSASNSANIVNLNVHRGQQAQQIVRVFNSVCIAPLLQYAAQGKLRYDLGPSSPWITFTQSSSDPLLGCDRGIHPKRPTESWAFNEERQQWDRQTEAGASRTYFIELMKSPQTFTFELIPKVKKLVIKCHPRVAAHRAAGMLSEGRGGIEIHESVSVKYRLSDSVHQSDPVLDRFRVANCNAFDLTDIKLKKPHILYDRQKRVITKCALIEDRETEFEEIEMIDDAMPGSAGWSLISRASRKRRICGGVIADAIGAGKTVVSIALILRGIKQARASRAPPNKSSATLVVVPPGLIDQWRREVEKFTTSLKVVCVYDVKKLQKLTVKEILAADIVISSIDILQDDNNLYLENLIRKANCFKKAKKSPKLPSYAGHTEKVSAVGVWIPATSQDPYGGGNSPLNQSRRNETAYYTYVYNTAIQECRKIQFDESTKGVPLEYFQWERLIVDEIHESLCTAKGEVDSDSTFKEKNRRAGRELLGITEKNPDKRPLIFRRAIFGLTGTPLLDHCNRVIELANLMGGTYVIGLSSHWRKLERESRRDIFLSSYLEPRQTREIRRSMYEKCQEYLDVAACRNKSGEEMKGIKLLLNVETVNMSVEEGKLYLKSQSGIPSDQRSFAIKPEDFDVTAGHDVSKLLRQNANLICRGKALVRICKKILSKNPYTKIIVFADGRIGAGDAARSHLCAEKDLGCTWLDKEDSVEEKNKKISWYQCGDSTEEDRTRARVLLLHFEHAAGLNLQTECNHLILFSPLYVGVGGTSGDAVADTSTELQAIGRVYRPGQRKKEVHLFRIKVRGPDDEECLDDQLIRRNTDEDTVTMAVNAAD